MSCGTCIPEEHHLPARTGARKWVIAAYLLLGLVIPLFLHIGLHFSPLVLIPGAFILVHFAIAGILALVAAHLVRGSGEAGAAGAHNHDKALILQPRVYDRLVKVATFGREARMRRSVLALAKLEAGDVILDVGCGTGSLLILAAEQVGATGKLCGIEPSAPMAAYAHAKAKAHNVPLDIQEAPAHQLPVADATIDALFCTMVLHHLPDDQRIQAVREMYRVLKPGGRVVIADVLAAKGLGSLFSVVALAHLRSPHPLMKAIEVQKLLTQSGFVEAVHTPSSGPVGTFLFHRPR